MTAEEVINRLKRYTAGKKNTEKIEISVLALNKLISALEEQEPKWIPVDERLPNLDDYTSSVVWQREVLITGYESFDDTKEPFVSEACVEEVINKRMYNTIITAWMPRPEPYKGETNE